MFDDGHHEFSPSKLHRLAACPGSYRLCKTQGLQEKPQEYTDEGKDLHKHIEIHTTPEDAEAAELVTRCRTVYQEILASIGPNAKLYHERTLQLLDADGEVLSEGTADIVIEDEELELITVIDWKFGRQPVTPARDNIQVNAYGTMAAIKRGWSRFRSIIFQPRIMQKPDEYLASSFSLSIIEARIRTIIDRAKNDPEMILSLGDHCTYCPARALCPLQDYKQSLVPATCKNLDPNRLLQAYELWKVLKHRGESIEYNFKRACEAGEIPGWTIVKQSGGREFTNVNDVASKLYGTFTMDELFKHVDMSVASVEDEFSRKLKEAGTVKTLSAGKDEFAKLMGDLIKMKPEKSLAKKVGK